MSVLTQHNDNARTGQNLAETLLTPNNVNPQQFGKLFAHGVDGYIYAQPLYLPGVVVGGAAHNLVLVATEHDSVYAFDADGNSGANAAPLWHASLLDVAHGAAPGAATIAQNSGSDIIPEYGITSTPVIDAATLTLYVVSASLEQGSQVLRLHALDAHSGVEKFGGPIQIRASIAGSGSGSMNGTVSIDPTFANQRTGLLLLNGIVYLAFGSHNEIAPWHGWILGYDAHTLAQTGVFCTTPNGYDGGVWMSGAGLAADQPDPSGHPFGRMFVATGNGDFSASPPYTSSMDFGDSHLALDLAGGVPIVTDEFTTNNQGQLDATDTDVGSGGIVLLPTQSTGGHPHLLAQLGKSGVLFLLDRDQMGGYDASADHAVQEIQVTTSCQTHYPDELNCGNWSSPAYFNGRLYVFAAYDVLRAFPLTNGQLGAPQTGLIQISSRGTTPSVSANGSTAGIVWAVDESAYPVGGAPIGPAVLQAYDASNVAVQLYSSSTNPARDTAGLAGKFAVPTIANGRVYLGTANELDVYGLLTESQPTPTPAMSPGGETFSTSVTVSLHDSKSNAAIYYTTDGSTPGPGSALYSAPLTFTTTTTLKAFALAPGFAPSAVASATYTLQLPQAAQPAFAPPGGTYSSPQAVTITDTTAGATIYYTADGSPPSAASTRYTGPVTVSSTTTLQAIAVAPGYLTSSTARAQYTYPVPAATPTFAPQPGTYSQAQRVTLSDALSGAQIHFTTDGSTPTSASPAYSTPLNVSSTQTIKAIATATGYLPSAVGSATYTISPPPPDPPATHSGGGGTLVPADLLLLIATLLGRVAGAREPRDARRGRATSS